MKTKKLYPTIVTAWLVVLTTFAVDEAVTSKRPRLLDLGAHACKACQMMTPVLDELTKAYAGQFDVEFIDVWQKENAERAKQYGIRSIPTQIFFDAEGNELWRHEGFISKEDILKKWKELGYIFLATKDTEAASSPDKSSKTTGGACGR